jgi:hypothetical protein
VFSHMGVPMRASVLLFRKPIMASAPRGRAQIASPFQVGASPSHLLHACEHGSETHTSPIVKLHGAACHFHKSFVQQTSKISCKHKRERLLIFFAFERAIVLSL